MALDIESEEAVTRVSKPFFLKVTEGLLPRFAQVEVAQKLEVKQEHLGLLWGVLWVCFLDGVQGALGLSSPKSIAQATLEDVLVLGCEVVGFFEGAEGFICLVFAPEVACFERVVLSHQGLWVACIEGFLLEGLADLKDAGVPLGRILLPSVLKDREKGREMFGGTALGLKQKSRGLVFLVVSEVVECLSPTRQDVSGVFLTEGAIDLDGGFFAPHEFEHSGDRVSPYGVLDAFC